MSSRLKVLQVKDTPATRKALTQEKFAKLWENNPEQFNPQRTAAGRQRLERTWELLKPHLAVNASCVDLGCGFGVLSKLCSEAGAQVTAVDIAEEPLQRLQPLDCARQYVPYTTLADNAYQLVIATELIAELPESEYRLFFSELARLVQADGHVFISSALDIYSENALERLLYYTSTEFNVVDIKLSYHALSMRLQHVLRATKILTPIANLIENSDWLLAKLEKLTEFFYDKEGVSHIIIACKRRPLFEPPEVPQQPQEQKKKQRVWE